MKREAMGKIQKAIAKLYFALGEAEGQKPDNAGITGENAECLAYLAIRNTGDALGLRYFAMGASSARRKAAKPPRGKSSGKQLTGKLSPPGGRKPEKQAKSTKILASKKALFDKAAKKTIKGDDMEFCENDFESGWEGEE